MCADPSCPAIVPTIGTTGAPQGELCERPSVVVIDNDPEFLALMDDILDDAGYRAIGWRASRGAIERLRRQQPAIVILDLWIEDPTAGWRLLDALRADAYLRHLPVIVCSAASTALRERAAELAREQWRTLPKPFSIDDLLGMIAALLPPAIPAGFGCGDARPCEIAQDADRHHPVESRDPYLHAVRRA